MEKIMNTLNVFAAKLTTGETGIPNVKATEGSLGSILDTVYMVAGIVAVIAIIIGAYLYVASAGNADMVKRGKNSILYAVVGLVVTVMAYAITKFVIGSV